MIEATAPAIDARIGSSASGLEPRIAPEAGDEQGEHDLDDVVERPTNVIDEVPACRSRMSTCTCSAVARCAARRAWPPPRIVVRILDGEELDSGAVERGEAEVVSVTCCLPSKETSRAKTPIPTLRAKGGRYVPPGSTKREPTTKSASPA
jgi:hypothetical protein